MRVSLQLRYICMSIRLHGMVPSCQTTLEINDKSLYLCVAKIKTSINMDKNSYALGMSIAHNMMSSGIRSVEFDDFAAGVKAVLTGAEPAVSFKEAGELLDKYFAELEAEQKAQVEAMSAAMKEEGEAFLKFNAEQEGVVELPSGLQYKVLVEGSGKKPKATDKVKCHYEGTLLNGAKFDSSYDRNEPAVFGLNQVIPGWTEGVQLMGEGSKYEFYT